MAISSFLYENDSGVDVYIPSSTDAVQYSHLHFFGDKPDSLKIDVSIRDDKNISSVLINTGDAIELYDELIICRDKEIFEHIPKVHILQEASILLCKEIDVLQQIEGFIPMTHCQIEVMKSFITSLLGNIEIKPSVLRCPIIGSYNYIANPEYDVESIKPYVSVSISSEPWNQAVESIRYSLQSEVGKVNFKCAYSYFIKNYSSCI